MQVRVNANREDQSGEGQHKTTPPKYHRSEKLSRRIKADRARSTQSHVHDPGGGLPESSSLTGGERRAVVPESLPTTVNLAKSFLYDEPKEEKDQLQDALAKSHFLDDSIMTSEDDETSDLGVANTISLPGFLADFLKGVGDRLQLEISDVELDIDIKVDVVPESSASNYASERSNLLTIRSYIGHITVNANSRSATPAATVQNIVQEVSIPVLQKTRRISLTGVQMMLMSDASLFANIARSTGPSSPDITHASIIVGTGSKPIESPSATIHAQSKKTTSPLPASLGKQKSQNSDASTMNDWNQRPNYSKISHAEKKPIAAFDLSNADDDSPMTRSFYSTSGASVRSHKEAKCNEDLPGSTSYTDASKYDSSALLSMMSHKPVDAASLEGGRTPPATFSVFPPIPFATGNAHIESGIDAPSRDPLHPSDLPPKPRDPALSMDTSGEVLPSKSSSSGSHTISEGSEDLAQSRMFSHEEAESMYMSALSHISAPRPDKGASMPGQWGPSSSDSSDEGMGPLFAGAGPNLPDKQTGIWLNPSLNRDGLARRHVDHGGQIPQATNPKSSEHIGLLTDAVHQPTSVPRISSERDGSSQGSEASTANLKFPFTIMKRILSIDFITLEYSQCDLEIANSPTPVKHQPPAGSSQAVSSSSGSTPQTNDTLAQSISILRSSSDPQQPGRWLNIDIGNIQLLSDMGLAKLMILVVEKLNSLCSSPSMEKRRVAPTQASPREASQVGLKMKDMCWQFVDVVKGTPVQDVGSQILVEQVDLRGDSEVLLRAEMKGFRAMYRSNGESSVLDLSARRLSFGYVSEDILSFDSSLKMRESTRDILAPSDNDIKIMIAKTVSKTKVELTTLPLHIALDSRRLDETFAWFGGLSSMLGLGSSMMSTVTLVDLAAKSSNNSNAVRGVRFENQEQQIPNLSVSAQMQNKVTARIGGVVLDLQGTRSSLRIESTAIKLVNRVEGLGLQVDRLNIIGPYAQHASSEPSTAVKLSNLRLEYLSTPREKDLDRLLALLSPSKDEYEKDDDILLDTLLRQRRQGGVVRATVENLEGVSSNLDDLQLFAALSEDLRKLSTVTKYLPEDDSPGILTLILVRHLSVNILVNDGFGAAILASKNLEAAHVAFPSLFALGMTTVSLHRNGTEELVGHALPMQTGEEVHLPMVMARFIGNEMEPTAKFKLCNVRFEYHVSTLMAIVAMKETASIKSSVAGIVSSVATLTPQATNTGYTPGPPAQGSPSIDRSQDPKKLKIDIAVRDSTLGLNPCKSPSKGFIVFTDTRFVSAIPKGDEAGAVLDIKKACVMVIDDRDSVSSAPLRSTGQRSPVETLSELGYVSVSLISAAKAVMHVVKVEPDSSRTVDIEIRDELFVLETCADSTQTLQKIMTGLMPPTPPCTDLKYRTEVIPVEDMLASFSGNAFPANQISHNTDEELRGGLDEGDIVDDEVPPTLEHILSVHNTDSESIYDGIADSMLENDIEILPSPSTIGSNNPLANLEEQTQKLFENAPLDFQDDHFGTSSDVEGTAQQQKTNLGGESRMRGSPLTVRVRDAHFIWNLYDGYDWQSTRDTIGQAIEDVQNKATERLARNDKGKSADVHEEEECVISDFLFNSIYIGIPAHRDPRVFGHQVSRNLDDPISETESYATSTSSGSPSRKGQVPRSRGSRQPRLRRSKHHKMTFELKRVSADLVVFPPDSEYIQSSLDIRVRDFEIFDHVPTSTWKKFATYMHEAGERESGTDMIHLEILNVKPVPNLAASEIVLKVR